MGNAESSFIVAMKKYRFYNAPSFCKVEKKHDSHCVIKQLRKRCLDDKNQICAKTMR